MKCKVLLSGLLVCVCSFGASASFSATNPNSDLDLVPSSSSQNPAPNPNPNSDLDLVPSSSSQNPSPNLISISMKGSELLVVNPPAIKKDGREISTLRMTLHNCAIAPNNSFFPSFPEAV
ncbi:MAG: hypothetical protein LBG13_00540 [Holosporales bacterium]|jgi:hypothetical protein|nr:hypothetical protein [Holosporales bacterium]